MTYFKYKKTSALILSAALSVGLLAGCGGKGDEKPDGAAAEQASEVSVSVETQEAKPQTIEQYVNISSKIAANNTVNVLPKVSGTVKAVNFKLGDRVNAGDTLFVIDDTDIKLQVQQSQASLNSARAGVTSAQASIASAQAGVKSAEAGYAQAVGGNMDNQLSQLRTSVDNSQIQYDDALTSYNNTLALFNAGAASQNELDNAKSALDKSKLALDSAKNTLETTEKKIFEETKKSSQASVDQAHTSVSNAQAGLASSQASVAQAEAALKSAQNQLNYVNVKAEISGVLSGVNVTEGSMASPSSVAMTIVDMNDVKVTFNVSDDVINRISVGSKAYITVSAASDKPFEGEITNVSPAADSNTGLYPVEIYINNADNNLKPGMFATLKLVVDSRQNTVSVPLNAVIEKGGEQYVFVVKADSTVEKRIVSTGIKNDEHIEITDGIKMGDEIVVVGQDFLSEGSLVSVTAES